MKFYLDIYIAVNLAADLLLLCITGRVMKHRCGALRLVCAALLGSLISAAVVFAHGTLSFSVGILTPAAMIFIAFGKMRIRNFFLTYFMFFGCSFVAGGMFAVVSEHTGAADNPRIFFVITSVIFFFCFWYFDLLSLSADTQSVDIIIQKNGVENKLHLLCDSGCLVREPIGGLPVILLSPKSFDSFFPEKELNDAASAVKLKKRLVPIKTCGGSSMISAVMPDRLFYIHKNRPVPCNAMLGRAETASFAGHDGIFPKMLLK